MFSKYRWEMEMFIADRDGCMNSLDWTTGLDYWTGLLDSLKMWFSFVNTILRADK